MLKTAFHALAILLIGTTLIASSASAQVPKPGPEHAKLKQFEGTWDFVLKSADGTESKGSSEFKLECGGLWLISDFKTDFGGMPFQGRGMDGYDPIQKKYVSVWVDSLTTAPLNFVGNYDESGKILTMTANAIDPSGTAPVVWRSTSEFISPTENRFEMFLKPQGGTEAKMMTVIYKKRK